MREPFDPIGSGPARVSGKYLGRLQAAAGRASAGMSSLPYSGNGDDSTAMGQWVGPDPETWLFARITARPDPDDLGSSGSAYYPGIACDLVGYSWVEVRPGPCGTWVDPPDDERLSGDNGTDDDAPARNPLFEANGAEDVPVGTVVKIVRGYQHGGAEQDFPGQEYVFFDVGGAGQPGAAAIVTILPYVRNPDDNTQHHAHLEPTSETFPATDFGAGPGLPATYPRLYLAKISRFLYAGTSFETGVHVWLYCRRVIPEWNFQFPEALDWTAVNSGFPMTGKVQHRHQMEDGSFVWAEETVTLPVYETTEDRPTIWVRIGAPDALSDPPAYSSWTPVRSALADGSPSGEFADLASPATLTPFEWDLSGGGRGVAYEDNGQLVDATSIVRLRPDPSGYNFWRFQAPVIAPCPDVDPLPEGYTDVSGCRQQFVGSRCTDGVTEYQRTIIYFSSPPTVYQSAWSSTLPPDPFAP